jgi:hypothetical protein
LNGNIFFNLATSNAPLESGGNKVLSEVSLFFDSVEQLHEPGMHTAFPSSVVVPQCSDISYSPLVEW